MERRVDNLLAAKWLQLFSLYSFNESVIRFQMDKHPGPHFIFGKDSKRFQVRITQKSKTIGIGAKASELTIDASPVCAT
jgi:hypothetical protein